MLCICHLNDNNHAVVDLVEKQAGNVKPFDPAKAVRQFAERLREYHITTVWGDGYAGETFRFRFEEEGIQFRSVSTSASDHYERFEVRLNAGEVELVDVPELIEEFLGLVARGTKITHESQLPRRSCRCYCTRGDHRIRVRSQADALVCRHWQRLCLWRRRHHAATV